MNIKNRKSQFFEKISKFNFNKTFSPTLIVFCHLGMWLFFLLLLFLYYRIETELSSLSSLILSIRGIVNNIIVFYIFFYFLIPKAFEERFLAYVFVLFCIPVAIYLWLTANYFQFKILYWLGIEIKEPTLNGIIAKNANQPIFTALSFRNVLGNAMLVIYSFSPAFFLKVLFDISKMFSKIISLQKKSLDLKVENINIEKNFLKSQLNPHFLFNTLNNLYSLVIKNDPIAPEVIVHLSDIMAYTLYESSTDKVALEKELNFLQNYFDLEKMRYSSADNITLEINIHQDISQLLISPLLTFPFIENGYKYGLKSLKDNFLKINITIKDNSFLFSIINNKENIEHERSYFGGIGVDNVKKRLQLLYPEKHELVINNEINFFAVYLTINLS